VLRTIFDALLNAENPLLVCGIDIATLHAEREIVELAERLALPVATGIFDYSSFPVHHPNYIGSVETVSEEPYDVVCCVGYRQSGRGGPVDLRFQQASMVIGMGHDHTKLGNTFALDVGVWGNLKPLLAGAQRLRKQDYASQPHIQRRAASLREARRMARPAEPGRDGYPGL